MIAEEQIVEILKQVDRSRKTVGEGASEISKILQENSALTSLDLQTNFIGDSGASSLSKVLKQNSTLQSLNLHHNKIGDSGAEAIGKALEQNNTLQSLDLRSNRIGDVGVEALGKALEQNSTLTSLGLGKNAIGDSGVTSLSEVLYHNSTLTSLGLGTNKIGDSGAISLSGALQHNNALKSLGLGCNGIKYKGAASLSDALQQNNTLISLRLGYNEIGDPGVASLSKTLKQNRTLTSLNLGHNQIGYSGMKNLLVALQCNNTLLKLNLLENKKGIFSDQMIKKINDLLAHNKERAKNTEKLETADVFSENTSNYNQNDNNNKIEQAVEQIVATPEESKKQVLIEQTLVAQVEHEEKAIEKVIDSRNEKVEEELREVQEKLKEIGDRTDAMWAEYVKKQAILLEQQAINTDSCPSVKIFYREVEKTLGAKLSAAINLSSGMLQRISTKTDTASGVAGSVVGQITNLLIPGLGSVIGSATQGAIKYAKEYAQELKYATTADIVNNVVAACELSEIVARKLTVHFRDNGNLKKMSVSEAVEEAKSLSRKVYGYIKNGEIKDNSSLESIALEIVAKVREEVNKAKPARFGMQKSSVKLAEDPNFRMLEHKVNKISEGPSGELLQKLMDKRVGDVEKVSSDENAKLRAELEEQKKEMARMNAMMQQMILQQQGGNMNTAQAFTAIPTQHRSASLEQRTLPQLPPRRSKSTDQVPANIGVANIKSRFEQNQNTR